MSKSKVIDEEGMEEETESEHFEKMDNLSLCESDGRNNAPEMDEDGFEMVKPRKKK